MQPCVFFDRDGIVNESPPGGFVLAWEAFQLKPGFVEALRLARERDYAAVVVTNQSCIARGLTTAAVVEDVHDRLRAMLHREYGLGLLDILYCPSLDDADPMRKPNPGMLLEAARRHGLDLAASWMVGDQERDIEAGLRAGCRAIRVDARDVVTEAEYRVPDMREVRNVLRRVLRVAAVEGGASGA